MYAGFGGLGLFRVGDQGFAALGSRPWVQGLLTLPTAECVRADRGLI